MPSDGPSLLSLVAAGFYVVITMVCLLASGAASRLRQPPRHWQIWAAIALVFAVLATIRVMGLEDILRDALRDILRGERTYGDRRAFQRPLAAGALALVSLIGGFVLFNQARSVRGRRNVALLAATGSALVMALLIALRIISLHQVDSLLYGPLKLNWVIDLSASLLVLGSAAYYLKLVRQRP